MKYICHRNSSDATDRAPNFASIDEIPNEGLYYIPHRNKVIQEVKIFSLNLPSAEDGSCKLCILGKIGAMMLDLLTLKRFHDSFSKDTFSKSLFPEGNLPEFHTLPWRKVLIMVFRPGSLDEASFIF